jgi:hypothetical protein
MVWKDYTYNLLYCLSAGKILNVFIYFIMFNILREMNEICQNLLGEIWHTAAFSRIFVLL